MLLQELRGGVRRAEVVLGGGVWGEKAVLPAPRLQAPGTSDLTVKITTK